MLEWWLNESANRKPNYPTHHRLSLPEHHSCKLHYVVDFADTVHAEVYSRVYERNGGQEYVLVIKMKDKQNVRFIVCPTAWSFWSLWPDARQIWQWPTEKEKPNTDITIDERKIILTVRTNCEVYVIIEIARTYELPVTPPFASPLPPTPANDLGRATTKMTDEVPESTSSITPNQANN